MLAVPPSEEGASRSVVEIFRVVIETMFFTAIPWASFMLGLSRIARVDLGMSAGGCGIGKQPRGLFSDIESGVRGRDRE